MSVGTAVHRIIEQRASATPDAIAIVDNARATTYRELNSRANALARQLCASGLTRGVVVFVRMPCGLDLAVVLLAILKAGACYAWTDASQNGLPERVCILRRTKTSEEAYIAVDLDRVLRLASGGSNLPVLTRAGDIACVLPGADGNPTVLVPHATIAALPRPRANQHQWSSGAVFDLWAALMSGATLSTGAGAPVTAAA